jgi:hypothetical protein
MVTTNVKRYEVLTPKLGKQAARMLAGSLGDRREYVSRDMLRAELDRFRDELEMLIDRRCSKVESSLKGSMPTFFIPLWLGTWGAMIAFVIR